MDTVFKDGKTTYDTVFHQVRDFELTNQFGQKVKLSDVKSRFVVIDFFFTSCPTICPKLTTNLKMLQEAFEKNDTLIQIFSITVDPERDTVNAIKQYANKFEINPDNWWILTGDKKEIYDLARHELFVSVTQGNGGPDDFVHTEKIVLLDKERFIRGYYNGLDTTAIGKLAGDIATINIAKDRRKPGLLKRLFSGQDH
ncbi:SCO family protein [Chitinophaga horti]|uniref:SCO family protein n=1 Tax=Chitinophaga horti TaxID=2920382 RepID=A0ABY6IYU4_9BACT|nr:SCO family protein [Chitinophaga horti]UYQ92569.1 SCO family protein [Chitinophaga horti]